ncbi:MAG TPA: tripartite tricarboxylate transporter TctB family protein, partial [Candidatus Methylomirabilis sp.]
ILMPGIGFVAATIVYVGGMAWGLGTPTLRRLPGALALGLITAVATFLIFERYLNVFLPRATWFQ